VGARNALRISVRLSRAAAIVTVAPGILNVRIMKTYARKQDEDGRPLDPPGVLVHLNHRISHR